MPAPDARLPHVPDLSAGECCAQAQMFSYARLEAARRAREEAAHRGRGWLLWLLTRGLWPGRR
ncbi:MAG TPA: hypothetical protein GX403_16055 [Rhodocyclaceae bacterium]|mgnify:FL=1|nr:hypothetical protein [Rhodocyclaceae bacterium]